MRLLAKLVAVANKMARIAWAIMAGGGYYRVPELAAAAANAKHMLICFRRIDRVRKRFIEFMLRS
jgi:hypothetical protein